MQFFWQSPLSNFRFVTPNATSYKSLLLKRQSKKCSHFCIFNLLLVIVAFLGISSPLAKLFNFLAWSTLYLVQWKYFIIVSLLDFLWSAIGNITILRRALCITFFINLNLLTDQVLLLWQILILTSLEHYFTLFENDILFPHLFLPFFFLDLKFNWTHIQCFW